MSKFMSIAAGVAIGYFLYQYFSGNAKKTIQGRIHKSRNDKKIAGVCAGIAEWLGMDVTLVRIAWALLCCGWGTGVLLYLICAFVLPEE